MAVKADSKCLLEVRGDRASKAAVAQMHSRESDRRAGHSAESGGIGRRVEVERARDHARRLAFKADSWQAPNARDELQPKLDKSAGSAFH